MYRIIFSLYVVYIHIISVAYLAAYMIMIIFYDHALLYAALLPDIHYMSLDRTKDAKSRHTFIVVV